ADGKYQQIMSGRSRPFSTRKYKTSNFIFNLPVAQNDTATFYLKVNSYFMQYPLHLRTEEKFIQKSHRYDLIFGFYFGFIICIVLYNFFVYLNVRDKVYLYYILYVISAGLMIAQLKGFVAILWGNNLHFLWYYAPLFIAISGVATVFFTQQILDTKIHAPKLNLVLNYLFLPVYAIIILCSLLGFNLVASILNQLNGMCALFFFYATAIVVYRKGYRFARFYIAACWAYFAGVVVYVLKAFTVLPFTFFTNNAIELGSTIEMIMFSFMLSDKINAFKKEKAKAQEELLLSLQENEKLIREQNRMLETKVTERTQELQQALHTLELSDAELKKKNQVITHEKERSENLLLNILPFETARELKETGTTAARYHEHVTVLFSDFKGFTMLSEQIAPNELVEQLDHFFKAFDDIMVKYGIEKIKTVGDCYMAAAGLPAPLANHAECMVEAAIEMLEVVERFNQFNKTNTGYHYAIRIGIHSGPVVAGVVGKKKFAYDIWGDTVNTASRMESTSEAGRINISLATYELVKHKYQCAHRGKIAAKNKGEIEMYFLEKAVS
ncbi:MAG TPA: adenylate/guanylate cyclase domain-containing protein, partial [Phnomibacter sp.]|nr:adenylate/guanylate cyclase domain-containing protein [Phnomibacter sp.]